VTFAHCYETGGMRRCTLHGGENILKRLLIHLGAFKISLVLRKMLGVGKPRELKNRAAHQVSRIIELLIKLYRPQGANPASPRAAHTSPDPSRSITLLCLPRWTKAT
jgi:hypothetical protein